jgi:hypothetical protein
MTFARNAPHGVCRQHHGQRGIRNALGLRGGNARGASIEVRPVGQRASLVCRLVGEGSRDQPDAPSSIAVSGPVTREDRNRLAFGEPGLLGDERIPVVISRRAQDHVSGRADETESRADDNPALSEAGENHLEEFFLNRWRAGDKFAAPGDDIQLQYVINLRTGPVTRISRASHAERAADRQHERIGHDRRRQAALERPLCDAAPERTWLGIEAVAARPADRIQPAGVDDDAVRRLCLAADAVTLATHRDPEAVTIRVGDDRGNVGGRRGGQNRPGQTVNVVAPIVRGGSTGRRVVEGVAVELRQRGKMRGLRRACRRPGVNTNQDQGRAALEERASVRA